jgi:hypothetical protein
MLVPTPKQGRPAAAVLAPVPGGIIGRALRESPAPAAFVKPHRRVSSRLAFLCRLLVDGSDWKARPRDVRDLMTQPP